MPRDKPNQKAGRFQKMAYVVLCGSTHTPPNRIVGPFDSSEEAARYAETQPGMPEHYAVVDRLTPPDDSPANPRPR